MVSRPAPKKLPAKANVVEAIRILIEGLEYHEHDGHNMPKKVARDALEALGIPRGEQP